VGFRADIGMVWVDEMRRDRMRRDEVRCGMRSEWLWVERGAT